MEERIKRAFSVFQPERKPTAEKDAFLFRVHSFSLGRWFGRPKELSPLECSRHGWSNNDVDLLACDVCSAQLKLPLLSPGTACSAQVELLSSSHRERCPWYLNPGPATLCDFPEEFDSALTMKSRFSERVEKLARLESPPAPPKLDLPEAFSDPLQCFALFGWTFADSHHVSCAICRGLIDTSLGRPPPKKRRTDAESSVECEDDVLQAHRCWCPWNHKWKRLLDVLEGKEEVVETAGESAKAVLGKARAM